MGSTSGRRNVSADRRATGRNAVGQGATGLSTRQWEGFVHPLLGRQRPVSADVHRPLRGCSSRPLPARPVSQAAALAFRPRDAGLEPGAIRHDSQPPASRTPRCRVVPNDSESNRTTWGHMHPKIRAHSQSGWVVSNDSESNRTTRRNRDQSQSKTGGPKRLRVKQDHLGPQAPPKPIWTGGPKRLRVKQDHLGPHAPQNPRPQPIGMGGLK